jgi:hypothetical protein
VRPVSNLFLSIALGAGLLSSAIAQLSLSADDIKKITPLLDSPLRDSLKCSIDRWNPSLDFAFRFVTGYVTYCRLGQFEGNRVALATYTRITPEGKSPALFGSSYQVPALPPELKQSVAGNFKKLKNEVGFSGAFALGEGRYSVEVLLKDEQNRTYRKRWKLRVAARRSERGVELAIKPLTVESVDQRTWQTVSSREGGLRLSILLDAAPINPYQSRLRAWDRAFLLETVYSVLRQTPHKAVHLVAFNLDQQREIFRSEQFDNAAFRNLSRALKEVELSSVSVKSLKNQNSTEFLIALANEELAANNSDAVILLGPNIRMETRMTAAALTEKKPASPPFFYFEYFPWVGAEFPDSIDWMVKAAAGKVFPIHTPAQLDQSIDRMLVQLKQQ